MMNEKPSVSNAVQLTGRQWVATAVFAALLFFLGPVIWKGVEKFDPGPDYRIPHELANDYGLFDRWAHRATSQSEFLAIGDSAIWGPYVTQDQTLSAHLNRIRGPRWFANLGVEGAVPLALEGLLKYYGGAITDKRILLHLNLLWMTSLEADYQAEYDVRISHPRLLPQFWPRIPGYAMRPPWETTREEIEKRLSIVFHRSTRLGEWKDHIQIGYFEDMSLSAWAIEHPYENPLTLLTRGLNAPEDRIQKDPTPWVKKGITKQTYQWVDLSSSLQWGGFCRALGILQKQGNRIFVLVGPFNEHMLSDPMPFQKIRGEAEAWLKSNGIAYDASPPIATELYGDASHPLAEGYRLLAEQLVKIPFFQ